MLAVNKLTSSLEPLSVVLEVFIISFLFLQFSDVAMSLLTITHTDKHTAYMYMYKQTSATASHTISTLVSSNSYIVAHIDMYQDVHLHTKQHQVYRHD